MDYPIHGRWKIEVCDQVVVQYFADTWNEEAAIAYIKEFQQQVAPLIKTRWAILSVFEDWQLGLPCIEKHIIAHCLWFQQNGCEKDCHVYSTNKFKEMQLDKLVPEGDSGYEKRLFTHSQAAIDWLNSQNFSLQQRDSAILLNC